MDIDHTAIHVSDLEATERFYLDGLGLERTWGFEADGVYNLYVAGESDTEIQFKHDPTREEPIQPSAIDHLALTVDDIDVAFEQIVEETGCNVRSEPREGHGPNASVAFIEDPDGYGVELAQRRE